MAGMPTQKCCCGGCSTCEHCDGQVAPYMAVTFTGVTDNLSSTCPSTAGNFNDTFILECGTGGTCGWTLSLTGSDAALFRRWTLAGGCVTPTTVVITMGFLSSGLGHQWYVIVAIDSAESYRFNDTGGLGSYGTAESSSTPYDCMDFNEDSTAGSRGHLSGGAYTTVAATCTAISQL